MLKRIVAGAIGAGSALNGAFMLIDGARWYDTVPGLARTGPYNPHFVADIGAAYLVAALALIARAWRPRYWPAAVAGAAFFIAHAIVHVLDIATGHAAVVMIDVGLVIIPAVLALWAAFPDRGEA